MGYSGNFKLIKSNFSMQMRKSVVIIDDAVLTLETGAELLAFFGVDADDVETVVD